MEPYQAARTIALAREIDPITSFYEQSDEYPKFHRKLLTKLYPGLSFFFRGHLLLNCERFCINFLVCNHNGDIALNLNARLPQNYISRNTKIRKKWGFEDSASVLPFQLRRGQKFLIQVLITHHKYLISVNSYHFASYPHRINYELVRAVEVRGDIKDVKLDSYNISEYPNRLPWTVAQTIAFKSLTDLRWAQSRIPAVWLKMSQEVPTPFYGRLPQQVFEKDHVLSIEGRVRLLPHSFVIDLQNGQDIWPQPLVAFRFCPTFLRSSSSRVGRAMVLRNTYVNGDWLQPENSQLQTTMRPGKAFKLIIACTADAFEVYLDQDFLLSYKYRMDPKVVDIVNIRGDLKLWSVDINKKKVFRAKSYVEQWVSKIERTIPKGSL